MCYKNPFILISSYLITFLKDKKVLIDGSDKKFSPIPLYSDHSSTIRDKRLLESKCIKFY